MKILKWIILMAAMMTTMAARVWAVEPPAQDAIKLHHRDGRVTSVAFETLKHLKFLGNNMILVNTTGSESVSMDDLSKITFFQNQQQEPPVTMIPVTFSAIAVGDGLGTLSAYVLENGVQTQTLSSGDEVQAGKTVKFKAAPNAESKIKGWRINGTYQASTASERIIVLNENQHANGLYVEVEFEKQEPTGVEDLEAAQNALNVYVQNRAINIESNVGIERIDVLDVSCRLLESVNYGRQHRVEISAEKLNAGLYLLKIRTAEREETRKVIIR